MIFVLGNQDKFTSIIFPRGLDTIQEYSEIFDWQLIDIPCISVPFACFFQGHFVPYAHLKIPVYLTVNNLDTSDRLHVILR